MIRSKPIPEGRECTHTTCSSTCHREPTVKRQRKPIKAYAAKPKKKEIGQDEWFLERAKEMTGICCNCNGRSSARSGTFWKWSIAHIFSKADFPSVATNKYNWLELCIECHTVYDRSLHVAHTMRCFPIAVEKFKQFESEIEENRKYLTLFREYANNLNINGKEI